SDTAVEPLLDRAVVLCANDEHVLLRGRDGHRRGIAMENAGDRAVDDQRGAGQLARRVDGETHSQRDGGEDHLHIMRSWIFSPSMTSSWPPGARTASRSRHPA